MLVEVQRGEMRGMAYESDGSWWQEYINDQWHRVQIEFTKLVVEANSSMPRPLPVSVPQPCPDTLAQKSAHVDTSRTALSSSGLPCSAVPSHPPQPPPLQRTALQSTSGAGAVFGGQVDTVVIKGFRNADLNGTYLVDAAIQAGGRATYWNQVHSHFLYYQLAEQRWAICRYESGEHDTLLDAQNGGMRGLAFEYQKQTNMWQEFIDGAWCTLDVSIQKLTTGQRTVCSVNKPRPQLAQQEKVGSSSQQKSASGVDASRTRGSSPQTGNLDSSRTVAHVSAHSSGSRNQQNEDKNCKGSLLPTKGEEGIQPSDPAKKNVTSALHGSGTDTTDDAEDPKKVKKQEKKRKKRQKAMEMERRIREEVMLELGAEHDSDSPQKSSKGCNGQHFRKKGAPGSEIVHKSMKFHRIAGKHHKSSSSKRGAEMVEQLQPLPKTQRSLRSIRWSCAISSSWPRSELTTSLAEGMVGCKRPTSSLAVLAAPEGHALVTSAAFQSSNPAAFLS